tara:strand:+ start:765 stop:1031 length:267 start_codon:yes stop_codon:yes gene_type:complete
MPNFADFDELARHYAARIRAGDPPLTVAEALKSLVLTESQQPLSSGQYKVILEKLQHELVPAGAVTLTERDNKYVMELVGLMQVLLRD